MSRKISIFLKKNYINIENTPQIKVKNKFFLIQNIKSINYQKLF